MSEKKQKELRFTSSKARRVTARFDAGAFPIQRSSFVPTAAFAVTAHWGGVNVMGWITS
ncbi:hypothetical protein QEH59_16635 [Coraliomargarita sp. SDUM461004]|uniref:Uncharacterized protein n=1 Tax=Thalassobacterium sedimentorum TaxID=3041258 RepID=A0ABU1AMP4_9BACT|nr:hypothetical protein [Coraliomargarita sp. SDUM461004]MDQ8196065.1 hypothetical protein [Coraliomargarita sp. SDUM461004]